MSSDNSKKLDKTATGDLNDNGVFLFMEDVTEDSCRDAIEFILEANLEPNPNYDHLTLIINSHGGSCYDGFALLDVMAGSKLPVHTVGIGLIASMGLLLFMGGKKGHRILTPRTMIMSHQWFGVDFGKEHELLATLKKNELLSKMIMKHYQKCTGMKEKEIREKLLPASDVWLTAEEAMSYGICDQIKLLG